MKRLYKISAPLAIVALLIFGITNSAFAAVSFVSLTQGWSTNPSGTTLSATPFGAVAGNVIYVTVDVQNAGAGVTISDSAGNTYTEIGTYAAPGGSNPNQVHQYYSYLTNSSASDVVTLTSATSLSSYAAIGAEEFTGYTGTPVVQGSTGNSSTGTTLVTGASLTVTSTCAFAAGMEGDGQPLTAGSGYTLTKIVDGFGGYVGFEYNITSTSNAPSATQNSSTFWGIAGAAICNPAPVSSPSPIVRIQNAQVILKGGNLMIK